MNSYALSIPEQTKYLATHKVVIDYTDLSGTDALTKTIAIFPSSGNAPIGTQIVAVKAKVVTAFVGCTTMAVEVGDGGDVDRNLVSFDLKSTAGTWKTLQPTTTTNNVFSSADTLDALFTAGTDKLTSLTAGEVHIYIRVCDNNAGLENL